MIKFEHTEVWGFEHAIRGMRNPLNSWARSDSGYGAIGTDEYFVIGKNDLDLMKRLIRGGSEHRKYLRQIIVSVDITAPLYWYKEFDTYKVGTTANSTSTMHKIQAKEFTLDDFSHEHLNEYSLMVLEDVIKKLNVEREYFNSTKDKDAWWQMIQLLPTSYNQKRTITLNYENIYSMYCQRKGHKLDEWSQGFIEWCESLPYFKQLFLE